MGLMGSLYIGTSGLKTSQNALNTTAHNMSNMDTVGFVRQQVQQGTRSYVTISKNAAAISYMQTGLGVNYTNVKQIRDYFLDKNFRRESGRSGYYDTSVAAVEEVENLFQELQGKTFSTAITNLWTSVQNLANDPTNSVCQGVFIQRSSEFLTRAKAVYQGLSEYQDKLNFKIKQTVDTINAYGEQISELNKQILKIESGGIEHANDLRDQRNLLIDELSAMGNITLYDDVDGNVLIKFEGNDLVTSDSSNKIELFTDEVTGFYTPYWKNLAYNPKSADAIGSAAVFDLRQKISTEANTDIGSLKALVLARGDHRATYEDMQEPGYSNEISQSIIMNIQAEFDQLIHGIVTAVNQVFKDGAEKFPRTGANADYPDNFYLKDSKGDPYQIFQTITSETEKNGPDPLFSVNNIMINQELKQAPSLLGLIRPDDKEDQDLVNNLKEIFTKEDYKLNPNVETKTTLIRYYDDLISQVANTGDVLRGISENQQIEVDRIEAAREQIIGVSSDEELGNMIMFQNAYNAASRYINVIDEMLEHIINTMAR